jgi:hypothetical protein
LIDFWKEKNLQQNKTDFFSLSIYKERGLLNKGEEDANLIDIDSFSRVVVF